MKSFLVVSLLIFFAIPASAIDAAKVSDDPELQARYDKIISEVRCLKCQNQTIKDSNAFLASDLRREIRRMLNEGQSDDEIYEFLVTRYGEFALYRPRTSGKTLFLWVAPFLFLFGGAIILWRVLHRRMAMPIDDEDPEEA